MPTSNEAVVKNIYSKLLNRAPSASELKTYIDQLDAVPTSSTFLEYTSDVSAILEKIVYQDGAVSREFDPSIGQVLRLYKAALGRSADFAGYEYYVDGLRNGGDLQNIAYSFSKSPEFTSKYGRLSNDAYIAALYQNVLSRQPSAAEKAYWNGKMTNEKMDRSTAILCFSESPENTANMAGLVQTQAFFSALAGNMPAPSQEAAHARGFGHSGTFGLSWDAVATAVSNGAMPIRNEVLISGVYAKPVAFDMQSGTVTSEGKTTPIAYGNGELLGGATSNTVHTLNLSGVSGKGTVSVKGSRYDDVVIAPSGGATIEMLAGNDTMILSPTASSTIVLGGVSSGGRPGLPYDNGLDTIGIFDTDKVIQGGFKVGKGGDVLDLHNFLGVTLTKNVSKPVDLLTTLDNSASIVGGFIPSASAGPQAVKSGDVVVIQTPTPDALTFADLNRAFALPVPQVIPAANALNLVVVTADTNSSHNAYVYAIRHVDVTNVPANSLPTFGGSDTITQILQLNGVNNVFIKDHMFDSSNFV